MKSSQWAKELLECVRAVSDISNVCIRELPNVRAHLITLPFLYISEEGRVGINVMQQLGYPFRQTQGMLDVCVKRAERVAHFHPGNIECSTLMDAVEMGLLEVVFALSGCGIMALKDGENVVSVKIGAFNVNGERGYCGLVIEEGVRHQIVDVDRPLHIQEPQPMRFRNMKVRQTCDPISEWDRLRVIYPSLTDFPISVN